MGNKRSATLQVVLGAVFWSFAGVLSKFIPWNGFTVNGIRSVFAVLIMGALRGSFRVRLTRGNLLGAAGASLTCILYMLAVKLTSAANAIVLQYAMPVFVIGFCWIFYGQRPRLGNVVTAAFVILGVILCAWDGLSSGNLPGDVLALLSAVTFSLVFFCSKLPGADSREYSFLGLLFCTPLCLCAFFDSNMTLNPVHWAAAMGLAVCLGVGYFFMGRGLNGVSPVSGALISNLEPILNPIWVFVFLGEQPGMLTVIGAVIVLTAATVYSIKGKD